jgi:hypothetical protein
LRVSRQSTDRRLTLYGFDKVLAVAAKPRLAIAALQQMQNVLSVAQLGLQHDKTL